MSTIKNSPFEERQNKQFGRYLIAKQDLPAGELIFKEAPLLVYSQFIETFKSNTEFTCITCYQVKKKKKAAHCKECNWSFCSEDCTTDESHRQLECPVLKANKVPESPKAISYLFLLRALQLKEKSSVKWTDLMNLTSSFSKEDPQYIASLEAAAPLAQEFLKVACKITVTISDIVTLLKIMKINSFSLMEAHEQPTTSKAPHSGLYATICLMPHSCSGNLEWSRYHGDAEERYSMGLYSREAISAGTMVSFSYKEDYNFEGTHLRRNHLLRDLRFGCQCIRCCDPTELGTFFSAVKCPNCEDGWVLPHCLVETSEDTVYKCEKCSHSVDVEQVSKTEDYFNKKLEDIDSTSCDDSHKSKSLDILIKIATAKYDLHPNHYLAYEAKRQWLRLQNFDVFLKSSPESNLLFQKYVTRAMENLTAVKLFGNLDQRVAPEAMIGMAGARFYFKSPNYLTIGNDVSNLDEKIEFLEKIVYHFKSSFSGADPRVYGPVTQVMVFNIKKRYETWYSCLMECYQQALKEK